MAKITKFVPSALTIDSLKTLQGDVNVLSKGPTSDALTLVSGRSFVELSVEWGDVVFRLECFGVSAELLSQAAFDDGQAVAIGAPIQGWNRLVCMMRSKWSRPAQAGEVPVDWDENVQDQGKIADIPPSAIAVGVSLIGIAFVADGSEGAVAAIISNDDNIPGTLLVVYDEREILKELGSCDCIHVDSVASWFSDIDRVSSE